jgi:hypothetical protein
MRLINVETNRLEEFDESEIPQYAILSHTWGDEEVSFQEINQGSASSKKGYSKIRETCIRARRHGLQYAWIDTCCIDKSSSHELATSINSMFQWYQNAATCYVYLSDLPSGAAGEGLEACKWFTRGWTLQEMIAPRKVRFYDQKWDFIGTKRDFSEKISSITGIDERVLKGEHHPSEYSVAARMSWAANRETERIEDHAYCLLGIFDISMALLYGEGSRSFVRLQEEIIRRNNDLTIFAWDYDQEQQQTGPMNLFASSAAGFARSKDVCLYNRAAINPAFSMTNKGLRFDLFDCLYKISVQDDTGESDTAKFSIPLGFHEGGSKDHCFMQLRKVGPGVYVRDGKLLMKAWSVRHSNATRLPLQDFFIHANIKEAQILESSSRPKTVHFPKHEQIQILDVLPESHWDETKRRFFAAFEDDNLVLATCCLLQLETAQVPAVVCINKSSSNPSCRIFDTSKHQQELSWLLRHKRLGHKVTWDDIEAEVPELFDFTEKFEIYVEEKKFTISVSLDKVVVKSISKHEIYSLEFDIKQCPQQVESTIYQGNEALGSSDVASELRLSHPHQLGDLWRFPINDPGTTVSHRGFLEACSTNGDMMSQGNLNINAPSISLRSNGILKMNLYNGTLTSPGDLRINTSSFMLHSNGILKIGGFGRAISSMGNLNILDSGGALRNDGQMQIGSSEIENEYGGPGQNYRDYSALGQVTGLYPCKLQAPSGTWLAGKPVLRDVIVIFIVGLSVYALF